MCRACRALIRARTEAECRLSAGSLPGHFAGRAAGPVTGDMGLDDGCQLGDCVNAVSRRKGWCVPHSVAVCHSVSRVGLNGTISSTFDTNNAFSASGNEIQQMKKKALNQSRGG